jgi:hypothetical protein
VTRFWVLPQLFKANATSISWPDEAGLLGYHGPQQPTSVDYGPLQFRWLLHPSLGLPLEPFELWRNQGVQSGLTAQEMADLPGWERLERIGLPVDNSWGDTNYRIDDQGPDSGPMSPIDAAAARLQLGAPRIGWTQLDLGGGDMLPEWEPPDLDAYHKDTLRSRLLDAVHNMLRKELDPLRHAAYFETETDSQGTGSLHPHLLQNPAAVGGQGKSATNTWHPLGLMVLAAGTDPLASLCLGFGTAMQQSGQENDVYMVSVHHEIQLGNAAFGFQLADVVTMTPRIPAPGRPSGVKAGLRGHTRPQVIDGPAIDTVAVEWDRVANPSFGYQPPETPRPVSYAIGRSDHLLGRSKILLTRRPEEVKGYLAFAPSKPDKARPAMFTDHLSRETTLDGEVLGRPLPSERTYAVAAQDLFGRWSPWETANYAEEGEPPQIPTVFAVELDDSGDVTVDFGWDWSSRTPEFVELSGAFEDDPGNPLLDVRIDFAGSAHPGTGLDVKPLTPDLTESADWGALQDRDPTAPEVRFYRLRTGVPVDFRGLPKRLFQVRARGQCHLTALLLPAFGVSEFGTPVGTEVYDPTPPGEPGGIPEAPQWASLRDTSGVSRALLRWRSVAGAPGYVLYEATETALLAAAGQPGPDPVTPYTARLARLRGLNLAGPGLRRVFRRLRSDLIPATSAEVTLPRGSTVIHIYAVTAMGSNRVESAWPADSKGFFAVAAPRAPVPAAPSVDADADPQAAAPKVSVRVTVAGDPAVGTVELYRTTKDALATDADTMGRPITTLTPAGGVALFEDTGAVPGWERISYRAVGWSVPDPQRGLIEARSPSSNVVSVLLPPRTPPGVSDRKVDEPGTTATDSLVSWSSSASARESPLGQHVAILELTESGAAGLRLEGALHALPGFASVAAIPPPNPADRKIVRVGTPESYRLYAWLPRPAAGPLSKLTVKVIDPLGRIGSATGDLAGEPPPVP